MDNVQPRISIIDYGVGNLFSLASSFTSVGADVEIISDPAQVANAQRIILPGVGAFGDAIDKLRSTGMADAVISATSDGVPLLGICLGMQLLFDVSYEYGEHKGLGLIPGAVRPIAEVIDPALKIPHIGWNALHFVRDDNPLFAEVNEGDHVYFVHSYYAADCEESLVATTDYSVELTAAVARGNVYGCQFHPEKSGEIGLRIVRAFCGEGFVRC
ncbi:MAG: imidazole glycerol phosphate synthase subunit HisH [Coriobacteriales bacterium]|nr:imidazole glycerol phosphate synthase subunit HisH [Coriobacteriales bacterium]